MINRRSFLGMGITSSAYLGMKGPALATSSMGRVYEEAKPLNLKITDLRTFIVDTGSDENFVFVKLYTNQGIVGLGEGTLTAKARTVSTAIEEHKRYLVGKDPLEIERHWQHMFRAPRSSRGGPVIMTALSAVEIALWDILGQAAGLPIYQLLGGKARDKVRCYVKPNSGNMLKSYQMTPEERARLPELSLTEQFLERKNEGWTAAKYTFVQAENNIIHPSRSVRLGIERLAEVREAVGPDFDLLVELHGKCTTSMAIDFCKLAEPYRPYLVEEATQVEDLGELELLRSLTTVPLATGERHNSRFLFGEICARHLVNYIQPDVVRSGGISEMKKMAALAEVFRIELLPHNPNSEVCTLASLHVCMCTPNATLLELGSGQSPYWEDLFYGGAVQFKDGYALAPERPGLGIKLNEEIAAKYPYEPKVRLPHRFSDGAITDR